MNGGIAYTDGDTHKYHLFRKLPFKSKFTRTVLGYLLLLMASLAFPLSLFSQTLNFSSAPTTIDLALTESDTIDTELSNTGLNSLDSFTYFIVAPSELPLIAISINGTPLTSTGSSGDTTFFTIDGSLIALANNGGNSGDPQLFEQNESFSIEEIYQMDDCSPAPNDLVRGVHFDCATNPACDIFTDNTIVRFTPTSIFAGNDQTICLGSTATLQGEVGFSNYTWRPITGGANLMGQTTTTSPTETTEYELTALDVNGCPSVDTVKVVILEASNFNVSITVPQAGVDQFNVCGPEKTVSVSVENLITDTMTNINVGLDLLSGFYYIPNSLGGGEATEIDNMPTFFIDVIEPGQTINFSFDLGVNCDGIATANSSGDKNLGVVFSCTGGGQDIFTQSSDNFELAKPTLTIPSSTPEMLNMYLGKIDTVTTRIVNGSQGELDSLEFFIEDHPELTIVDVLINNISIPVARVASGRTYFVIHQALIVEAADILGDNGDATVIEFNEFFDIQEVYQMTSCNDSPGNLVRGVNYGCDGQVCEESTRNSSVAYGTEQPFLEFSAYTGFSTDMNPLCYSDNVIVSGMYIANTGLAPATNIDFRLDDYAPHGGATTTGFDAASVMIRQGENGTASVLTPSATGGNNCSGFPNNLMFNLGSLVLNQRDTLFIQFDRYTGCGCSQATGQGCQVRNVNSWQIRGENTDNPQYRDLCDFNLFEADFYRSGGERATISTFLEAPIEIGGGEAATNIYNIPFFANTFYDDCPTCYLEAIYSIGNGVDVTGLMWVDNDGNMWTPDIFDYTDNGINGGGGSADTLIVRWTGAPPNGFSPSGGGSAILLKYIGDCEETGMMCAQGAMVDIRQEIRFYSPTCTSCTPQFVTCPINNTVEIECPSCDPCDGLVHTVMEVQRATLGAGDNDDDGIPEAGEFIDSSAIRLDRVIRGDTVRAHYEGFISGSNTYEFAYATLDMAISDYLPLGAEVTIYDADIDTFYTCNVIQQFRDGSNLVNNLSVASLNGLGCATLPTDFVYAPGDSISVDFYFRILQDVSAGVHNQLLASRFFVSDEAFGGVMFRCNDLQDNIYQIGLFEDFFIQGDFTEGGCNLFSHEWEQRTWLGNGGDAGFDYFPNEYRENWRFPATHTVTKPALDIINFQIIIRNKGGNNVYNQTVLTNSPYVVVNGEDYTLNVEQYVSDNGGMPFLDDGARFEIRTRLRGGCFTEIGTHDLPYSIGWALDPNFFGQVADETMGSDTLTYTGGPLVGIQANQSLIELSGENACFNIRVSNANNNTASNTFLQFQSNSGAIVVQSIREITEGSDSLFLDPNTDIYQLGDLVGNSEKQFQICVITNNCAIDSLILNTGWSCTGYPATSAEAECVASDVVRVTPIDAELGMTIVEPAAPVIGDLCTQTPYELILTSGKLGFLNNINLRFFLPPDVTYVPNSFELAYPVPLTGSPTFRTVEDPDNPFGNVFEINISEQDPILDSIGLIGTTDLTQNFLRVRFMTETSCGYTSGSKVRFLSWAFDACGELTNFRFSPAEALEIIGVTAPFISDVGAGNLEINPCVDQSIPIDISLAVGNNSDPVGPNDSVRVLLPIGLQYVPNSYQSIQNSVLTPPRIEMLNGEQILYFDLIDGLSAGQQAMFTFDVSATVERQQCTDYEMVIQSFSSANVLCQSTGEFCNVRAASDEFSRVISYVVPSLEFTDFQIASVVDGNMETYTTSATLFNNSSVSVPNGFTTSIDIYADIDNNGRFSAPDSLLGAINTTDGIPALTSVTITGGFTIPTNIFCNLIAVSDNRSNCTCPTAYSFPVKAETSYVFDKSYSVCSGDTIQIGPSAIDGFTYGWLSVNGSNTTAIEAIDSAQTNFSFVNVSGASLEWQFALRTIKDGDCFSYDTIAVTVYPQRDASIATQGCAGFPASLSGPRDGTNYQWTPTTGLDNPNSPSTSVVLSGASTYNLTYTDPNGCTAFFEQTISEGNCAGSTTIGDYVWLDENRDGVQDPAEFGIPNVLVFLYNANDLTTPIASTLTDFSGRYLFNPLPAGEYVVGFSSPGNNFTTTVLNASTNTAIDSDVNPTTLQTSSYVLANGDSVVTVDAGFVEYECAVNVQLGIERICLGESLQLGASIGGDVTNYFWQDAIDLAPNPEPASTTLSDVTVLNPVFTPGRTGAYTFYFIGSNIDPNLCSDTAALTILVEGEANPVILAADSMLCAGATTTLFASGGTTYEWFENGLPAGNGTSLAINPSSTATYRLQATTDFGCVANTEKIIIVLDALTVSLGDDQAICEGEVTTLTAPEGFEMYEWVAIQSGIRYAGDTILVSPTISTDYELTVVDSNGCSAIDTVSVMVNGLPIPAYTFGSSCGLNPIAFSNNSTNAVTYEWDFGDGNTSIDANPSHTFGSVGTYIVQLKATNAEGCMDSISQQINVGTITASLSTDQQICNGAAATLIASGGTSYLWKQLSAPNGTIVNDNLGNDATLNTGNLINTTTYRVVVDNGICVDSLETTVTVLATQTFMISGDNAICEGETASLTADAGFSNYTWVAQNNGTTFSGRTVVINPLDTTTYQVSAIDNNGCEATGAYTLNVHPVPQANFSIDGDCQLNPIVTTNTSSISSGNITNYSWDFGDGVGTSVGTNPSYMYASPGTYTIQLTAISDNSCAAIQTQAITVGGINTYVSPTSMICPGENSTLVASGGDNYVWKQLDAPNGNIVNDNLSNLNIVSLENLMTTSYYRVIISNSQCIDSLETSIAVVTPTPINAGVDETICAGEFQNLTATFGFDNYQWVASPSGAVFQGRSITVSPTENTSYTLTANDANGCVGRDTVLITVNSIPSVGFTISGSCGLNPVNFTNTSIGGSTYSWDFGDGTGSSTDENPSYTYSSSGIYQVKLIVTNSQNCSDSLTQQVSIGNLPITVSPDQNICAGQSASLSASGGNSYQWKILDAPNGSIINNNAGNLPNFTSNPLITATTFRVVVGDGNCTDSLETTVSIFAPSIIDAGLDQMICEGQVTTLSAQAGFNNYQWQELTTGLTFNGRDINLIPTQSGSYALQAIDVNGCTTRDTVSIFINETPAVSITNSFPTLCPNGLDDIRLVALPTMGVYPYSYEWTGPNGFTATDSIVIRTNPTEAMSGIYTLQVRDANGCESEIASTEVTVRSTLNEPILTFSGPLCEGSRLLISSQEYEGQAVTFFWSHNQDTLVNNSHELIINPVTAIDTGKYALTVIVDGCVARSDTLQFNILSQPMVSPTANFDDICEGGTLQLMANATDVVSYEWSGPNNFEATSPNPLINNISITTNGEYSVTVTNINGCQATAFITIDSVVQVLEAPAITSNSPICEGEDLELSTSASGVNFEWIGPLGNSQSTQQNNPVLVTTTNATSITAGLPPYLAGSWTVQVTDSTGCVSTSNPIEIMINPIPIAEAFNDGPICPAASVELLATVVENARYEWRAIGDTTLLSTLQNPTFNNIKDTTHYELRVLVDGCSSERDTTRVIVWEAPQVSPIASYTLNNDCSPADLQLLANVIPGADTAIIYQWTGLNGFDSRLENPIIPNAMAVNNGTYNLEITDGNGCSAIGATEVTIIANSVAIPFITGNGASCEGERVVLNIPAYEGSTVNYTWHKDSIELLTDNNFEFLIDPVSILDTGSYSVVVEVDGCLLHSPTYRLDIYETPDFTLDDAIDIACATDASTLQFHAEDISGSMPLQYQWTGPNDFASFQDTVVLSNISQNMAGVYSLQIIDANGCQSLAKSTNLTITEGIPEPTISTSELACHGGQIVLSIPQYTGASIQYDWSTPTGENITGQNSNTIIIQPVDSALHQGSYSVMVSVDECTAHSDTFFLATLPSPTVNPTFSLDNICEGGMLQLAANAEGALLYEWSGPNDFTASSPNPSINNVTAINNGEYGLTVTNGSGCQVTAFITIDSIQSGQELPTITSNSPICEGEDLVLRTSTAGLDFEWIGPLGGSQTTLQENAVLRTDTGTTTIPVGTSPYLSGDWSVRIMDSSGCVLSSMPLSVEIRPIPIAEAFNDGPICPNETVALQATNVPNARYEWRVAGDSILISTLQNPTIDNILDTTAFELTVTVDACTSPIASTTVLVYESPSISPTSIYTLNDDCAPADLQLLANVVAGADTNFTYQWIGPNTFISPLENPTLPDVDASGNGAYSLSIIDGNGCTATGATQITTIENEVAIPFIRSLGPTCEGSRVVLEVSEYAGTNVSYTWVKNGQVIAGNNHFQLILDPVTIADTGAYFISIVVDDCTISSQIYNLEIYGNPQITLDEVPTLACATGIEDIMLNASVTNGVAPYNFEWTGPNDFFSVAQNPTLINANASMDGSYTAFVTDVNGCQSPSATVTVDITESIAEPIVTTNAPLCTDERLVLTTQLYEGVNVLYEWYRDSTLLGTVPTNEWTIFPANTSHDGNYWVSVQVDGCQNISDIVEVIIYDEVVAVPSHNGGICGGDLQLFANISRPDNEQFIYQWTGPNGYVSNLQNPIIINPSSENEGSYVLQVVDENTCRSEVATTEVSLISTTPDQPFIQYSGDICEGEQLVLSTLQLEGNEVNYEWIGPNNTSTVNGDYPNNPLLIIDNTTVSNSGTYQVTISVEDCETIISPPIEVSVNERPNAQITSNDLVCSGSNGILELIAEVNGGQAPYSYQWEGPNTFNSVAASPTIDNPNQTTSGTYTLGVQDANGCAATIAERFIQIPTQPTIPALNLEQNNFCEGMPLLISTNFYQGDDVLYHWTIQGDSITQYTTQSTTLLLENTRAGQSGSVSVSVEVDGCRSEVSPIQLLTIYEIPAAPVLVPTMTACEGTDIQLNTPTVAEEYNWFGPNGFTATVQQPMVISNALISNAGIYTLSVVENGCISPTSSVEVVTLASPSQPTLLTAPKICEGEGLVLSVLNPIAEYTYQWVPPSLDASQFPGTRDEINDTILWTITGQTSIDNIVHPNFYEQGAWQVRAIDNNNCTSALSTAKNIDIIPIPANPLPANSGPICQGESVQLLGNEVENARYEWFAASADSTVFNLFSTQTNPQLNSLPAGNYNYFLNVSVEGCYAEAGQFTQVVVKETPQINLPLNQEGLCEGDTLLLNAPFVENALYQWGGPNDFTSFAQNPVLVNANQENSGSYQLKVVREGCESNTASTQVRISPQPTPPAASHNGPVCEGTTLQLTASNVFNGNNLIYEWSGPDDFRATIQNPTVDNLNVSSAGIYTLSVGIEGCFSLPVSTIPVEVKPTPPLPTIGANASILEPICEGDILQLESDFLPNTRYQWVGPNGFTSNLANPFLDNISTNHAGTYQLNTVVDGCLSPAASVDVGVLARPNIPLAANNGPVCAAGTLELNIRNPNSTVMYEWFRASDNTFIGEGERLALENIAIIEAGDYYVIASNDDCATTAYGSDGIISQVFTSVIVENPPKDIAFAGDSILTCEPEIMTNAIAPQFSNGFWSVASLDSPLEIINPNSTQTLVKNLETGINKLTWSLESGVCGIISVDTLLVLYNLPPTAQNDTFSIGMNEVLNLRLLANDDLITNDVNIYIDSELQLGEVIRNVGAIDFANQLDTLSRFTYFAGENMVGTEVFEYQICNKECPDLCASASVVIHIGTDAECVAPHLVTPNNDGDNDAFIIPCLANYSGNSITIFNRWGDEVYKDDNYQNDWVGEYNDAPLPTGTYYYLLEINDGNGTVLSGYLFLQR